MKSINYSFAREHLAETITKVCEDHDPVVITKKQDSSVVMISLDDYQSLQETAYLLRSPKNAKRLFESISQIKSGKGKRREI